MPKEPHHSKNWGGARREPSEDPAVKVSVSLPASLVQEVTAQAYGATGECRSEVVVRLLRAGLEAEERQEKKKRE